MKKITLRLILLTLMSLFAIMGCSAQEASVGETAGETVQNEAASSHTDTTSQEAVAQVDPTDQPTQIPPTDLPPTDIPPTPRPTQTPQKLSNLPDLGVAPDITNEVWLNAEPHTLEDLRGKVVLVEFWTYS